MLRRWQVANLAQIIQITMFWAGQRLAWHSLQDGVFGDCLSAIEVPTCEGVWQLGCESGLSWAREGPRGPKMAQDRPTMRSKGVTGDIDPTQGGGSGPPRGSKILNRKLGESEAECDPKSKRRSAEDLTRR